jgi:hypothetical protein
VSSEPPGIAGNAGTAVAAGTTATATATGTTTAATLAATAAATLAATTTSAVIATRALRTGDAIDHVVELAARDRAVRALLALEHANEANVVDAATDDVECLEEARGAIGLNAECGRDCTDRWIFLLGRFGLRFAAFTGLAGLA